MICRRVVRPLLIVGMLVAVGATGCVERRFVVETNVPGALVYVNTVPVGPSPADARWDYAGKYEIRAVAQGYEPLREVRSVHARWYEYPPFDFFAENLWPFHIEDVRRFHFDLRPASQPPTNELIDAGNALREQARQLPPPKYPDPPKPATANPAPPPPPGRVTEWMPGKP